MFRPTTLKNAPRLAFRAPQRKFFLWNEMLTVLLSVAGAEVSLGAFTTVIDSPPASLVGVHFIGSSTQLNLYPGAVTEEYLVIGNRWEPENDIEINVEGGTVSGSLSTYGVRESSSNVVFNIRSGLVKGGIGANNGNVVNVSGGVIEQSVSVHDAVANISGGSAGQLHASGAARMQLVGGDFRLNGVPIPGLATTGAEVAIDLGDASVLTGVLADGSPLIVSNAGMMGDYIADSTLHLKSAKAPAATPGVFRAPGSAPRGLSAGQRLIVGTDGVVSANFDVTWGSSVAIAEGEVKQGFRSIGAVVDMSGGTLGELATAYMGSVINISGGNLRSNFNALRGSQVNITGGNIDSLFEARGGSEVNISGGVVQPYFLAHPDSRVAITGSGFRVNGVPLSGLGAVGATRQVDIPAGAVLSGTLADGRQFAFSDQQADYFSTGTLTLRTVAAPEPGPAVIHVPGNAAPTGLRKGQTLFVSEGGEIGNDFNADWGSVINIDGGQVGHGFEVVGSMVNITGGNIGWRLNALFGSVVNISGGNLAGAVQAHQGSAVNISGGDIGYNVVAHRGGVVNVSGGSIGDYSTISEGGLFNVSGGRFGEALTSYGGVLNFTGGAIGDESRFVEGSTVNMSGGTVGDELEVHGGSRLALTGKDFRIDGEPLTGLYEYGPATAIDIPQGSVLSGTLIDGTPFAFSGQDGDHFEAGALWLNYWPVNGTYPGGNEPPDIGPPAGVGAGESLIVNEGQMVGDDFGAAWGSAVTIVGGQVGRNFEAVGAQVLVAGGSVGNGFDAFCGSVVTVTGGTIGNDFQAHNGSIVNITGGEIGYGFTANSGSVVNVTGGALPERCHLASGSIVNVAGGVASEWFEVHAGSELHFFGTDFLLNGQSIPGLSPGSSVELDGGEFWNYGRLSGTLADGNTLETYLSGSPLSTSLPRVRLTWLATADFNGDGVVDASDLNGWKTSFGTGSVGDADGDMDSDGSDFLAWQRQLGGAATGASVPVPEPAAWRSVIALTCAAFLGFRRAG